mmetsp:Transcript_23127/g.25957  ORF Transcript_23127/g.25957 Transcript_23127/m.25957 type:complete len:273 (+) Transcript_23127:1637-2455(+)
MNKHVSHKKTIGPIIVVVANVLRRMSPLWHPIIITKSTAPIRRLIPSRNVVVPVPTFVWKWDTNNPCTLRRIRTKMVIVEQSIVPFVVRTVEPNTNCVVSVVVNRPIRTRSIAKQIVPTIPVTFVVTPSDMVVMIRPSINVFVIRKFAPREHALRKVKIYTVGPTIVAVANVLTTLTLLKAAAQSPMWFVLRIITLPCALFSTLVQVFLTTMAHTHFSLQPTMHFPRSTTSSLSIASVWRPFVPFSCSMLRTKEQCTPTTYHAKVVMRLSSE